MGMRILGLDQSYKKSGIVIVDKDKRDMVHYEIFCGNNNDLDVFAQTRLIGARICNVVIKYNIDIVVIEGLAFGSVGNVTRNLAGLQFTIINMLQIPAFVQHIPIVKIVPATTLKKFATGRGNAKKEEVIDSLPPKIKEIFWDKLGVRKTTGMDDMADAYFLAQYGLAFPVKDEIKAVDKTKKKRKKKPKTK